MSSEKNDRGDLPMRGPFGIRSGLAGSALFVGALALGGCGAQSGAGGAPSAGAAKPAPAAPRITQPQPQQPEVDYDTYTQHFIALQSAGLAADYDSFISHMAESAQPAVMAAIRDAFGGQAFDSSTAKTFNSATHHRRMVELRGTRSRLYLYVELTKVPGGWEVTQSEIGRNRGRIVANL